MFLSDGRRWCATLVLIASATAAWPARADMLITDGMEPWETCAECHNLDGISAMPKFPKLAGQRPDYIVRQVRDFRDGRRHNDGGQMAAIAGDVSDKDLERAAAYFGGLPPPPADASQSSASADLRRGAMLYQEGDTGAGIARCGSCHDETANETPSAPLLKAQHAGYLTKQLRDWRSGERRNDIKGLMPAIAAKLSDSDIAALAAFLATQPRAQSNRAAAQ